MLTAVQNQDIIKEPRSRPTLVDIEGKGSIYLGWRPPAPAPRLTPTKFTFTLNTCKCNIEYTFRARAIQDAT